MTTQAVLHFMQKTAESTSLQQQLEQLLGCGDGYKSNVILTN